MMDNCNDLGRAMEASAARADRRSLDARLKEMEEIVAQNTANIQAMIETVHQLKRLILSKEEE